MPELAVHVDVETGARVGVGVGPREVDMGGTDARGRDDRLGGGVVSLRSVAVTVLLAPDQPPLELTAYTRNEYVLL